MISKQVKITEVKPNPENPRLIKDHKFKQLVKSIKEFPEMLKLREVVVDENMVILGGNMRYKACIEAGLKKIDVVIFAGLTEEQKKEFVIKDNVNYGVWDWDILANNYDTNDLTDWGLSVWNPNITELESEDENESTLQGNDTNSSDEEETEEKANEKKGIIQIEFNPEDYDKAFTLYQDMKKKGIDVGLIFLNKLKEELCK
jgi:hypothetical protein